MSVLGLSLASDTALALVLGMSCGLDPSQVANIGAGLSLDTFLDRGICVKDGVHGEDHGEGVDPHMKGTPTPSVSSAEVEAEIPLVHAYTYVYVYVHRSSPTLSQTLWWYWNQGRSYSDWPMPWKSRKSNSSRCPELHSHSHRRRHGHPSSQPYPRASRLSSDDPPFVCSPTSCRLRALALRPLTAPMPSTHHPPWTCFHNSRGTSRGFCQCRFQSLIHHEHRHRHRRLRFDPCRLRDPCRFGEIGVFDRFCRPRRLHRCFC